jgi:hypothetical protein
MSVETRKAEKLQKLSTEAIENILGTLAGPELEEPSQEFPLGGIVQIDGIGQVTVKQLRAELARR